MSAITDEELFVSLRLLDRRVVDADGEPLGRVDDLVFEDDGASPPRLVGILMGPEALGARLGGVLGDVVAGAGRLRPDGAAVPEVAMADLETGDSEVRLRARRHDLDFPRSEAWVRDHVIGRIPGAQRSSEGESPGEPGDGERPGASREAGATAKDAGTRLRASSLLGARVVDRDGRLIGTLRDLRLRSDGEAHRIQDLVTGRGVIAERLGYAYGEVRGPWVLVALMRRLARRTRAVPWADVTEIEQERIIVRQAAEAYGPVVDAP